MADNDNGNLVAPGYSESIIRSTQKGVSGGPKTRIMVLDRGGAGAEDLVNQGNPLPVALGPSDYAIYSVTVPAFTLFATSTAEQSALNLNGVSQSAGQTLNITYVWAEDAS